MSFIIGQRWLSHADPQLGLGIVTESDPRRVTVMFPAVEEERTYAVANAPLSRIAFREMALQGLIPGVRKASW